MNTIEEAVRHHAAQTPSHAALVTRSLTLTYAQLWRGAVCAAQWLQGRGVAPGHRVAVTGTDEAWFPVLYLGIHLARAAVIPLDPRLPSQVREDLLAMAEPHLLLDKALLAALRPALEAQMAAPPDASPAQWPVLPGAGDIADILFTSGSTGRPKGVVLTHANLVAAARNINAFIGNGASDREVVTVPLNHSFGLGRLRCSFLAGGTLILVPGLNFPALIYKALAEHAATGLACVPAGAAVLLKPGPEHLATAGRSLRFVELGSAPMEPAMKQALMDALPQARLCMHYGLTEASRSAFIEFHADAGRLASVGRASPNVQIQICDDAGTALEAGQTGRIRVKADTVMREYWRDPERSARVLDPQGWLDTGDIGWLDGAGYLFLAGRKDDLINVGGKKVYPPQVEGSLALHPDVLDCMCVGAPDPDGVLGEIPVAYVIARHAATPDAEVLMKFAAQRLEPHAVPRRIRFVEQLPRSASGKPMRSVLRTRESAGSA